MSLLETAKNNQIRARKIKTITNQEIELSLAVLSGEVSVLAATKALNYKSPNGYSYRLLQILKKLHKDGIIKIINK